MKVDVHTFVQTLEKEGSLSQNSRCLEEIVQIKSVLSLEEFYQRKGSEPP